MRTPEKCTDDALDYVAEVLRIATHQHGPFHSAHEGLEVIREELKELQDEVYLKSERRDPAVLFKEAAHVAAMGLRFMVDIAMPLCEAIPERCGVEKRLDEKISKEIIREAILYIDNSMSHTARSLLADLLE